VHVESLTEQPVPTQAPDRPLPTGTRWRAVARFGLAAAGSAATCLGTWSLLPRTLSGPIDVVGYPSFANFDYQPALWAYRLGVYAFPLLLAAAYAGLARFGPLRSPARRPAARPVPLAEPPDRHTRPGGLGLVLRLAVPAVVVAMAVSARAGRLDAVALGYATGYPLIVVAIGLAWPRIRVNRAAPSGPAPTGPALSNGAAPSGPVPTRPGQAVALVNGVGGAVVALLGLWFVAQRTVVFLPAGAQRAWPWLPLWTVLLGAGAVLAWAVRQIRRGRDPWRVERALLTVVVGSVALFLATSALPAPVSYLQGLDDSDSIVGAALLRRGYLPWRDVLFVHGPFYDALSGSIGTALFGDSLWGVLAGTAVLLAPLCWVFLYLYGVWVARGNAWFAALVWVACASGFLPQIDIRYLTVPLTLVLLGEALRHSTPGSGSGRWWAAGLGLALVGQAVLFSETLFLALPVLGCLVAADLLHRDRGARPWAVLHRTRWCFSAAAGATLVLVGVLLWYHAFRPFLDFFLVFMPNRAAEYAIPPRGVSTRDYLFAAAGVAGVLLTVWGAVWRVRRRGSWTARDWVGLAAAGYLALYGEKALDRFDYFHVEQQNQATLPLLVALSWTLLAFGDRLVDRWTRARRRSRPSPQRPRRPRRTRRPFGGLAAAVALVALVAVTAQPLRQLGATIGARHQIVASADPVFPRLGYATLDGVLDPAMLRDLDTVLRAYAADSAPVFDMSNSPGYIYYLLGRTPGTRFVHVDLAMTPYAQRLLIGELSRSRPPLVVFDSTQVGLSTYDWINPAVRHYAVSQYILDGWVPLLKTHGFLVYIRRDLAASTASSTASVVATMPSLIQPPTTANLWFSTYCSWGTVPDFLPSPARGALLRLPVRPAGPGAMVHIGGWAVDPDTGGPASAVVLVRGAEVLATMAPSLPRPDLAAVAGAAAAGSGFEFSGAVVGTGRLALYALTADGRLHPLGTSSPTGATGVRLPDGRVVRVAEAPVGAVDRYQVADATIGRLDLPPGVDPAAYHLLTLAAPAGSRLGTSLLMLSDGVGPGIRGIDAQSLPRTTGGLPVRVGSCPQWHGYDPARPLYVAQIGGVPVASATLSGVGDA
jgi:hypothetical protein